MDRSCYDLWQSYGANFLWVAPHMVLSLIDAQNIVDVSSYKGRHTLIPSVDVGEGRIIRTLTQTPVLPA